MAQATKSLKQLRKAAKLTNRAFHKNGPKSWKKGVGALLKALHKNGAPMSSRELVDFLGFDRKELKNVVRKAEKMGFVEFADHEDEKTYTVTITPAGDEVAEKRAAAQNKAAEAILSGLTAEEIEQLDALTEKIILSCKEQGAHGKHMSGKKHHHHHHKCHCKKH